MSNEIQKIQSFRYALAIAETFEDVKKLDNQAAAIAEFAKREKLSTEKQNELGRFRIEIEGKKGEWLNENYPQGGDRKSNKIKVTEGDLDTMPVTKRESARARKVADLPVEEVTVFMDEIENEGDVITPNAIYKKITDKKKEEKKETLQQKKEENAKAISNDVKNNKPVVYNTDCVSFLNTLDENSVDLLITDPPYSTDIEDIEKFAKSWVNLALSKVKQNGRAFICIGAYPKEIQAYMNILLEQKKFIVDNPLVWTYRNTLGITPKMKYNLNYQMIIHLYSDSSTPLDTSVTSEMWSVQDINAPDGRQGDRYHTWQKPNELGLRLIRHTTKENDLVIDPFACTGTFPLMAAKLNRVAIGCDVDSNNLLIAEKRGCDVQ